MHVVSFFVFLFRGFINEVDGRNDNGTMNTSTPNIDKSVAMTILSVFVMIIAVAAMVILLLLAGSGMTYSVGKRLENSFSWPDRTKI